MMDAAWARLLLHANLVGQMVLLAGALWCIALPSRRIYPMERKDVWFYAMWGIFAIVFLSNPVFIVLDWNSGPFTGPVRFWLAGALAALGGGLVLWGMATLGAHRTSGLPESLVAEGPYLAHAQSAVRRRLPALPGRGGLRELRRCGRHTPSHCARPPGSALRGRALAGARVRRRLSRLSPARTAVPVTAHICARPSEVRARRPGRLPPARPERRPAPASRPEAPEHVRNSRRVR